MGRRCALAVAVAFASAPAAHAATVNFKTFPTDCSGKGVDCAPVLVYAAAPGESNDVQVTNGSADSLGSSGGQPTLHIHDAGADIAFGNAAAWCTRAGPHDVDCAPPPALNGDPAEFKLGDGDDRLTVSALGEKGFTVIASGGTGADKLDAASSAKGTYLGGGPGRDLLIGGPGRDSLSGDGTVRDDYPYAWLEGQPSSDSIDGGGGEDVADYGGRKHGVVVDLVAHRGGEPGERDSIMNVEDAFGGSGPDHLLGNGVRNYLDGGQGDDFVAGRGGNDRAYGAGGADRVSGGPGNDVVGLGDSDDARNVASCGTGSDHAVAGPRDAVGDDCESVGDIRLLGPLRTPRSAVVGYDTQCTMIFKEQLRHNVCQIQLSLVAAGGIVVGRRHVRSRRTGGATLIRIRVPLNSRGRAMLKQSRSLHVKVRLVHALTRQHGPVPRPATTLFTTVIRLAR